MNFAPSTLFQASLESTGKWIAGTLGDMLNTGFAIIDEARQIHPPGKGKPIFLGIEPPHGEESIDFLNTVVLPYCKKIENKITDIPWHLANETTEKLLTYIFHELYIKRGIEDFYFEDNFIKCERIRLLTHIGIAVIKSIVHQHTTVLELKTYTNLYYTFDVFWQPELYTKLNRVAIFRLLGTYSNYWSDKHFSNLLKHLKLKEFTFSGCTHELLKAVAEGSSESLLILNVPNSPNVTDECLITFKRFKNLMSINIRDTGLSQDACSSIINYMFSQNNVVDDFQLKSYQGIMTARDFDIIVKFNKVYKLGLEFEETFNVDKLKCMKYLTRLDINGSSILYDSDHGYNPYRNNANVINFHDIIPILEFIGHQLREITLRYIHDISLRVIEDFCPTLQHLGLFTRENYTVCYNGVQGMPSVKSLTLGGHTNELSIGILRSLNRIVKLEFNVIHLGIWGDEMSHVDLVQSKIKSGQLKELVVFGINLKCVGHWEKDGIRIENYSLQDTVNNMILFRE